MSWLNGLAEEKDILNQAQALEFTSEKLAPGFFTGALDVVGPNLERGFLEGASAIESGFSSLWQSGLEGAAGLLLPEPKFGGKVSVTDAEQSSQETLGQGVGEAVIDLRPDPTSVGMAGQIIGEAAAILPRTAAATLMGGPLAGAVAAGAPAGYSGKQVAMAEGVDESTATLKGVIDATTVGIGALLPVAKFVKPVLGDLGIAVGANVALGAAGRGLTGELLEGGGYAAQAEQYKAMDATGLATDAILGAAFFGIGRASMRRPNTQQVQAALTENNARHFDVETAPGLPADPRTAAAHQKALTQAADQLNRGEPVSIPDDLEGAAFVRKDPAGPINDGLRAVADDVARADARAVGDDFAARVGRAAEYDDAGAPVFRDGTAYPLSEVSRFFDQFVAARQAKDGTPMPDVLFQVGRVDDATAQGLRDYLSGFNENLREARISARVIKHIQDSRPSIVRDVLDRLERGVLQADEVLPNQKDPKRVMLVLRDTDAQGSQARHQSTVIELSANGKGVDVVSAMTMPERTLNKARAYKQELDMSRTGGPLPPSSLGSRETQQPHAAAASEDFLAVERDSASIDKPAAGTTAADPVVQVADEIMARADDIQLPTGAIDADGNPVTVSAKQMMAEADADIVRADQDSKGFAAAAACFLQRGFK